MAYLASNKIDVFPATRRTFESTHARQVTEAALVGLVNKLIDVESFVVTKLSDTYSGSDEFSFNIHGYYFTTTLGALTDFDYTDLYASITLDVTGGIPAFYEIDGQDVVGEIDYEYQGVNFTAEEISGDNTYCLYLLHKNDSGKWEVPESSQIKFSPDSLNITLIDGGEIIDEIVSP